jgi:hypothetical protein
MRRYVGPFLILVAIAHLLLFAVLHAGRWAAIARDGVLGTVDGDDRREAAFWTMGFGLLLLLVGDLLRHRPNGSGGAPASAPGIMLVLGIGGGVLMPLSPFWLFVPVGLVLLATSHRPGRRSGAASLFPKGRHHRI